MITINIFKATCRIYVRNPSDSTDVALAESGTIIQSRNDFLSFVVGGPYDGWISTASPKSYGMTELSPLEVLGAQAE